MLEVFIQSFVLYFVVIDPLGNAPIFISVTQLQNTKDKIKTAFECVLIATIILVSFSLIGKSLLSHLNISLHAFQIAGGIILFLIALEMLFNKRKERKEKNIENISDKVSIFPLAIPILAGPASIISVIVMISDFEDNYFYHLIGIISLITVMIITLIFFLLISKSEQFINKNITNVFSRVIAILLAGLSTQYIIDGIIKII